MKSEIDGRLEVIFRPATATFHLDAGDATNPARKKLAEVFGQALRYAGPRYPRPDGIDRNWEIVFNVTVDTDKSQWW